SGQRKVAGQQHTRDDRYCQSREPEMFPEYGAQDTVLLKAHKKTCEIFHNPSSFRNSLICLRSLYAANAARSRSRSGETKRPAHSSTRSPERLALNSSVHMPPLRNGSRFSCLSSHCIGSLLDVRERLLRAHEDHMAKVCQAGLIPRQDLIDRRNES